MTKQKRFIVVPQSVEDPKPHNTSKSLGQKLVPVRGVMDRHSFNVSPLPPDAKVLVELLVEPVSEPGDPSPDVLRPSLFAAVLANARNAMAALLPHLQILGTETCASSRRDGSSLLHMSRLYPLHVREN
eukprot:CAMPEP_0197483160 /NCGR_PEP_ID=MMETSP1309-20131121/56737_1 /TAXON_ID=464262 /ORGANISM="Genus nov. species nov., Strain RCC998" /LENGTH=128 /DNA_ID=CAMNT_0043025751 /DNA_START=884 /DNA_END=1271 /DNA_ORIENTATION=-